MNCWNVFIWDKLTLLSPANVIALTTQNSESM